MLAAMTYTSDEGRRELLGATAEAADTIGVALAALGAAYELVDDDTARSAGVGAVRAGAGGVRAGEAGHARVRGAARAAASAFAVADAGRAFGAARAATSSRRSRRSSTPTTSSPSCRTRCCPVEVGDPELRAALADVRTRLGEVPVRAAELLRTLGR